MRRSVVVDVSPSFLLQLQGSLRGFRAHKEVQVSHQSAASVEVVMMMLLQFPRRNREHHVDDDDDDDGSFK
jgi:hypothetical protein